MSTQATADTRTRPAPANNQRNITTVKPPRPPAESSTIRGLLEGEAFKAAVAKSLPRHLPPDRFIRIALTALMRTPKLADCDRSSFFQALLSLSQLGLEPDGRRAHLIPFNNRKRGVVECQLIVDYKGLVELAMRSGQVSNIHADVVCENDEFDFDRGKLERHRINFREDRGAIYAVYAIVRFKDGSEKCDVMTRSEVEKIRARSFAADDGPWVTDWQEMAKKTVFRRLSKWLPLSAEFRDAVESDPEASEDYRVENARTVFDATSFLPAASDLAIPQTTGYAPEPDPEPDPAKPADPQPSEAKPAPAPAPTPSAPANPQEALASAVITAGFTFDDFRAWAAQTGNVTETDSLGSFDDIPPAVATRLLRAQTGLLRGLTGMKGGAK
jgi:recombination protein RecT